MNVMFKADTGFSLRSNLSDVSTRKGNRTESLSTECSSTHIHSDSVVFSLASCSHHSSDIRLKLPHKSIMTVRTHDESISESHIVKERRRRKRLCRFWNLEQSGLLKGDESSGVRLCVSFRNDVLVREYAVGMGDSPSVSAGVPISLIGEYKREYSCAYQEYEEKHGNRGKCAIDFVISAKEREVMLHRLGYSWKEIHQAAQVTNQIKAGKNDRLVWFMRGIRGIGLLMNNIIYLPIIFQSQRKLSKDWLELSRRMKIHYDLEEEAILAGAVDVESLSSTMKSKYLLEG